MTTHRALILSLALLGPLLAGGQAIGGPADEAPPPAWTSEPPGALASLAQAEAQLEALAQLQRGPPSPLAAYALARSLVDLPAKPRPVVPVAPGPYLASLAPDADLSRLETLPPATDQALAELLGVHRALQAALDAGTPPAGLEGLRAGMLAAAAALAEAAPPPGPRGPPVDVCGALYLDLSDQGREITCDHIVSIAGYGSDTYRNRAGGAAVGQARLAIDLGGHDRYLGQASTGAGINGGAFQGAGALIDLAGDDLYQGRIQDTAVGAPTPWPPGGINGGARLGLGLLLDLAGNDTYRGVGGNVGINGGASFGGSGALIDLGGRDELFHGEAKGWTAGVNGGSNDGSGLLVHCGAGNNTYTGSVGDRGGVNAGGEQGTGVLVSCGGSWTTYSGEAGGGGVNGGASGGAQQVLLHLGGDALFHGQATYGGINGGAFRGTGALVAGPGQHTYTGHLELAGGINGGAALGQASLVDLGGPTTYTASSPGTTGVNGGAVAPGLAILVDAAGDDTYDAAVDGEAWDGLVIGPYSVAGRAVNGEGSQGGCGWLLDLGGQDRYRDGPEAPWHQDRSHPAPGGCGGRWDG